MTVTKLYDTQVDQAGILFDVRLKSATFAIATELVGISRASLIDRHLFLFSYKSLVPNFLEIHKKILCKIYTFPEPDERIFGILYSKNVAIYSI